MHGSVFTQVEFWITVVVSVVLPFSIYSLLLTKRSLSRTTVMLLGFSLVVLAGIDVYLLQSLAVAAKKTASLADDAVFLSEVSLALYILPAMFGGIGVNVISHILVSHLVKTENQN